jgi:hypothetical protein
MLKSLRIPPELLALHAIQRAASREAGTPLFLPAYDERLLEAREQLEEDDQPVEAGGLTIGGDDDDFY